MSIVLVTEGALLLNQVIFECMFVAWSLSNHSSEQLLWYYNKGPTALTVLYKADIVAVL